ncbi:MAG: xanthine dehydrogenase family protein subunit M [Candidatus Tectomicrobia bacterium]|nr:xanthine dehydrogenase family protein subunit M [Candidatus Tectomicrobia bacterium]
MKRFAYFKPKSVEEAFSLMKQYGEEAKVLAGGTDLLIYIKSGRLAPKYIIDIKEIPGFDFIRYDEKDGLRFGAATRLADFVDSEIVNKKFYPIVQAAGAIGTIQIQNRATIGGNICNAAPSADVSSPLVALGANVTLVSLSGERTLPLEDFFLGPGKTVLARDELLREIHVPNPPPRTGSIYLRLAKRSRVDIAVAGVSATVTLGTGDGICQDVKIVLCAVAPIPLRAKEAEGILKGKPLQEEVIGEVSRKASEEARPITDVRGTAEYRKEIVKVLTKRSLIQAAEIARSN